MAEGISSNQDLFTCPICLDILKDPVTVNCGDNYCMDCIKGYWDQDDQKGVYSCPRCRQSFTPRPVLNKNNVFAELVEQFRRDRVAAAFPAVCAAPGDVECDVCTGRKLKAVKSCLDCLFSYCETHFKDHNNVNPGRKHNVVDATGQLQERICTQHEKPLEIFCRTDQSCVCFLCLVDEHKGHDTVSASAGRKEKQSSAQTAVEDSERIFAEMICSIERRRSEVTELIRAQEKAELTRAEGLLKRLEQKITELKKRDAELEQLLFADDHIHFLKTVQSVSDLPDSKDSSVTVNQSLSFEAVRKLVFTLRGQLNDFCNQEILKISAAVAEVQVILPFKDAPVVFMFGSSGTEKDFKFSLASTAASESGIGDKTEGGEELPLVSLPKIEVKSGEEEEEILFKERTKLYRFDLESMQWKDRGVGDIKILFHSEKKHYRVVMRRAKVFNVCANHFITQATELKPAASSASAFVWTITDYADGRGKGQTLAAKFRTQELAESFKKVFTNCQARMSKGEESSILSSKTMGHSNTP